MNTNSASIDYLNYQPQPPYSESSPLIQPPPSAPPAISPEATTAFEGDAPNSQQTQRANINCRVCSLRLSFVPNPKVSLIRCPQCKECTQVGPPPPGKQFLICQCNALLSVSITARAAECPRPHCKRTTILKPAEPGKQRAFCGHCNTLLSYNWSAAVVICPKCHGRSVVNNNKMITYSIIWFVLGFMLLGIGVGVTIWTYVLAETNPYGGIYVVMYGPMVFGAILLIRALIYTCVNCNATRANFVGV